MRSKDTGTHSRLTRIEEASLQHDAVGPAVHGANVTRTHVRSHSASHRPPFFGTSPAAGLAPVRSPRVRSRAMGTGQNMDARTPVIVGAGQFTNRTNEGADPLSPIDLMLEAAAAADRDSGTTLAERADVVAAVPVISWKYTNPGRMVADGLGNRDAATWYPAIGGNSPQMLLNRLCSSIAAGEMSVGLLCGGEAWLSTGRARRDGKDLGWPRQDLPKPPTGAAKTSSPWATRRSWPMESSSAVDTYPLFETALMHAAVEEHPGRTMAEQLREVGEMWAGFSERGRRNPYAWSRDELTADEIITPTQGNRYVSWPYTKRMVSNPNVDMASALIVCDLARQPAQSASPGTAGLRPQRHRGQGPRHVRAQLLRALTVDRVAGRRCLELAGVHPRRRRPPRRLLVLSLRSPAFLPRVRHRSAGSPADRVRRTRLRRRTMEQPGRPRARRRWWTCCAPTRAPSASSRPTAATWTSMRSACSAPSHRRGLASRGSPGRDRGGVNGPRCPRPTTRAPSPSRRTPSCMTGTAPRSG